VCWARVGKGDRIKDDAASDQPRQQSVQQAQQPFEGEYAADQQRASFGDAQAGLLVGAFEADAEVGKDQAEKADAAFDGLGQRRRGDRAAAEELEAPRASAARKARSLRRRVAR
jgi:hypothetical protein